MIQDLSLIKTGPQLQRALSDEGLHHCHITKERTSNRWIARFYERIIEGFVEPADHWIPKLQALVPDAAIVAQQDIHAHWRTGNPCISATIWFELPQTTERDLIILAFILLANRLIDIIEKFLSNLIWLSIEMRRVLFRKWWNRQLALPLLPAPKIAGYLPVPRTETPIADAIEKHGAKAVAALHYMAAKAGMEAQREYWEKHPPKQIESFEEIQAANNALPSRFNFDA